MYVLKERERGIVIRRLTSICAYVIMQTNCLPLLGMIAKLHYFLLAMLRWIAHIKSLTLELKHISSRTTLCQICFLEQDMKNNEYEKEKNVKVNSTLFAKDERDMLSPLLLLRKNCAMKDCS